MSVSKGIKRKKAIYSRKSKYTGKGESIGNQVDECKEYLKHIKNNCSSYDITKIAKYVREKINN